MKNYTVLSSLLLLAALLVGCSGGGGNGQSATSHSSPPPVGGGTPAEPPNGAPSTSAGAIVVYAENDSVLKAVRVDGGQPITLADNATFRGVTDDGWVVFLRGEQLLSIRLADGVVRILDDSPGGKNIRGVFDTNYIVYEMFADKQSSVHVVRADGTGHLVPVPPQPQLVQLQFVAVTPGRRVLYEICDLIIDDGVHCVDPRLMSVKLDGSDQRVLFSDPPFIRHITADDLLVYSRSTQAGTLLSVVKSDGSGSRTLAEADSFFAGALPNGRIVYHRIENGQFDLYSVATDGSSTRALATSAEDEFFAGATPDGRVLFRRGAPMQHRVYSVVESTGDIRVLLENGDGAVQAVTPNGTVIVSARFGAVGQEQDNLYSVRPDGSNLRTLADTSDMEWFEALAPDGRVIYRRCIPAPAGPCGDPSAQSDLYSVYPDGTGTVALAASGAFEAARGVTQDNRVIYELLNAGQSDLYSVPTTGGQAQPLANTAADEQVLAVVEPGSTSQPFVDPR